MDLLFAPVYLNIWVTHPTVDLNVQQIKNVQVTKRAININVQILVVEHVEEMPFVKLEITIQFVVVHLIK